MSALQGVYDFIKSLPIESMGRGNDGEQEWPLRDEVLHNIAKSMKELDALREALKAALPAVEFMAGAIDADPEDEERLRIVRKALEEK